MNSETKLGVMIEIKDQSQIGDGEFQRLSEALAQVLENNNLTSSAESAKKMPIAIVVDQEDYATIFR